MAVAAAEMPWRCQWSQVLVQVVPQPARGGSVVRWRARCRACVVGVLQLRVDVTATICGGRCMQLSYRLQAGAGGDGRQKHLRPEPDLEDGPTALAPCARHAQHVVGRADNVELSLCQTQAGTRGH